ncbi:hypothetical protein NF27_CH00010, partial [Candidatus Jidaibacter acanthamoeba]
RVLKYSIGNASTTEIQKEINECEKSGVLIRVGDKFTTQELLEKEKQILNYAKKSLGAGKEIINEKHFVKRCQSFEMREKAKDPN